jgi:hypothetical protein
MPPDKPGHRGFVCQVWMAGAPIAARMNCWTPSIGSYLQTCLLTLRSSLPKVAQLSRAITSKNLLLAYSVLQMADLNRSVSGKGKCLKMTAMRRN